MIRHLTPDRHCMKIFQHVPCITMRTLQPMKVKRIQHKVKFGNPRPNEPLAKENKPSKRVNI